MKPFVESNDIRDDSAELHRRADRDGYLFFRDLVNKEAILQTRGDFVAILAEHGWIDEGTDPMEAITTQPARIVGTEEYYPVLEDFQTLESFQTLAHDPNILDFFEGFFGEAPLVHPRTIGRIIFPSKLDHTTPPHQDILHIQGSPNVWTAWFPLGNCSQELGGLGVLTGSHKVGMLPVHSALGAGLVAVDTESIEGEWVGGDFRLGDLLFFHSHMVHKGLPNKSGNRIRLSVDYRYQKASEVITDQELLPHRIPFTWEQVYEGWKSDKYQFYWKDLPLNIVPFDSGVYQVVEEESQGGMGENV